MNEHIITCYGCELFVGRKLAYLERMEKLVLDIRRECRFTQRGIAEILLCKDCGELLADFIDSSIGILTDAIRSHQGKKMRLFPPEFRERK